MLQEATRRNVERTQKCILNQAAERRAFIHKKIATQRSARLAAKQSKKWFLYFSNVTGCSALGMRKELNNILPRGAVLCVDFIGESVKELFLRQDAEQCTIATLKAMGYKLEKDFDPVMPHIWRGRQTTESGKSYINAKRCLHRVSRMLTLLKSA